MPRSLLVTIDAFGTLFHPRLPVPDQYAATAHAFGLSPSLLTSESLQPAFKAVFKAHAKQYPNYGRELALRGCYGGPRQWWEEVIRGSFARALNNNGDLPEGLVQRLLDRFASREGYTLYDDAEEFFARMREVKSRQQQQRFGPFERVVVGVLSNSDDRVPGVLKSLGLRVGDTRADQGVSSMRLAGFEERSSTTPSSEEGGQVNDLDLIITSYEAGEEKPNPAIFDVAKRQAMRLCDGNGEGDASNWACVHVGDDYSKDYRAAIDAGWEGYYLPRGDDSQVQQQDVKTIHSLTELFDILGAYK